jgi:hypothetical protein
VKSSHAALGVLALAVTGLWYGAGGPLAPAAAASEQVRVADPLRHENLTIYLIHGPDVVPESKVASLQEALAAGWAVIHETGNVNTLQVENRSPEYDLFMQEGDIIRGGKQDRMIAMDMIVPAGSTPVGFPCHCVENGRWTGRGKEAVTHFSKSDQFVVGNDIKLANATRQQGEVWNGVAARQKQLCDAAKAKVTSDESASSLQLTLESPIVQAKIAGYVSAFEGRELDRTVVGAVFMVNGEVRGAEVYGSNALFRKAWPKLLRSASVEAFSDRTDRSIPACPAANEVERFLAVASQPQSSQTARNGTSQANVLSVDLINDDVGLQENLEPAIMGRNRVDRPTADAIAPNQAGMTGRSGVTRNVLLREAGGNGGGRQQSMPRPTPGLAQQLYANPAPVANDPANPASDVAPQLPNEPANPGYRLNVNRVANDIGLVSESRDATRQNALIHKSLITVSGKAAAR